MVQGRQGNQRHGEAGQHLSAELLELAHDAIFVRDVASAVIRYWNRGAEEMYGYSRQDALGKVSHVLLRTQFPQPLHEIEDAMLRDGQWEGELIHRTRGGRHLTVEGRWALQRDAHGEPIAFLEINRDITARKEAERQVRALNAELAQRVQELADANVEIMQRNRESAATNSAVLALSQDLDFAQVLQNIVDAARELIHSRYAALGVSDSRGKILQFITSGITPQEREAIGPLPQGHGLLGVLIGEGQPLRIPDISRDPRRHGFPAHHPPMKSLLGVPIFFQGRAVGDLYLTDKLGAPEFSRDDENLLLLLANHAAIAISHARLYEQVRTARDLYQAANRELEGFAYSVSHDLRAPLRHLDGFSQVLLDRYSEMLDDRGRRYLHHIRDAAQDMGTLIDALLRLARVGHREMRWEQVDVSALARAIGTKLHSAEPERDVRLAVAEGAAVEGDAQLLEIVLENLLRNAWKFTRQVAPAVIEFCVDRAGEEMVYTVRDNGAGFDMQYADKLFSPFQRLHRAGEFEGTGIGLATVQRIVHRHGGRVWAEGKIGEGAVFSFTLSAPRESGT